MLTFFHHAVAQGFTGDDQMTMLQVSDQADALLGALFAARGGALDDD